MATYLLAVALVLAMVLIVLLVRHARHQSQALWVLTILLQTSVKDAGRYKQAWREKRAELRDACRQQRRDMGSFAMGVDITADGSPALVSQKQLAEIETYANTGPARWRTTNDKDSGRSNRRDQP